MDNKKLLLENALILFSEKGYDSVGVQEIVEKSGVTKPTLYYYFQSKEGLLSTLVEDKIGDFLKSLKESANYEHDLPLTLYRVVKTYFQFALKESSFYRLMLSMTYSPPESILVKVITPPFIEQHRLVEEIFSKAEKDHGNMRGKSKSIGATLIGMINTYISLYLYNHVTLNDELCYKSLHQFMHGIYS